MKTRFAGDLPEKMVSFLFRYVYAALSCLYLFAFGFFRARNRAFISQICETFGLNAWLSGKCLIPKIALDEVIQKDVAIKVYEPVAVEGNITLLELIVINNLIAARSPRALFEIGTFDGRTTLNMALNAGPDAAVYTLDLSRDQMASTKLPIVSGDRQFIDKEISGAKFKGKETGERIIELSGDSATFDFSPYLGVMDFVFIDGSHSYDYVLNDSRRALSLLRQGRGIIVWHDCGAWEGVTKALNELYLKDDDFKGLRHIAETSLAYLVKNG